MSSRMAPRRAVGASPAPSGDGSTLDVRGGGTRSASPTGRRLAADMRRMASLLRLPPSGDASPNDSTEGLSNSASTSALQPLGAQIATPSQLNALAERVNSALGGLQRQRESDKRVMERRLQQLEQRVDSWHQERSRDVDGRKKWAEVQGSVHGLLEELQGHRRHVESLEERFWARTSGLEMARQRCQELEQQVQGLDQQNRLADLAKEEAHRRQATRIRCTEHGLDEVSQRLAKLEEEARMRPLEDGSLLEDLEDLCRRVELLEQQGESASLPSEHSREVSQAQDAICELAEQVSRLVQRTSCGESSLAALQQKMQQVQAIAEQHEDGPPRTLVGFRSEVGALAQQVADIRSRLIDIEGDLDFVRQRGRSDEGVQYEVPEWHTRLDVLSNEVGELRAWCADWEQAQSVQSAREQAAQPPSQRQSARSHSSRIPSSAAPDQYPADNGFSEVHCQRDMEVEQFREQMEELSRFVSYELSCKEDMANSRAEFDGLGERLGKFEESLDLYLSYVKCVASDHSEQVSKMSVQLQDSEVATMAVQQTVQVLQSSCMHVETTVAQLQQSLDSRTEGTHSEDRSLEEMRDQIEEIKEHMHGTQNIVASLQEETKSISVSLKQDLVHGLVSLKEEMLEYGVPRHGSAAEEHEHQEYSESLSDRLCGVEQRLDQVLSERLCAIERQVDSNCGLAVAHIDKLMSKVFAQLGDMSVQQNELAETKVTVASLSERVSTIQEHVNQSLARMPCASEAVTAFRARFEGHSKALAALEQEQDPEYVDGALQKLQVALLQSAEILSSAVQQEMLNFQGGDEELFEEETVRKRVFETGRPVVQAVHG